MVNLNYIGMNFPLPEHHYVTDELYVIYGTGEVAYSYYVQLCKEGLEQNIVFFIDSSEEKSQFSNKKVCKPDLVDEGIIKEAYFILASYTSAVGMENKLISMGVDHKRIIKSKKYTFNSFVENTTCPTKIGIYPKLETEEQANEIIKKIEYYVPNAASFKIKFTFISDQSVQSNRFCANTIREFSDNSHYDLILVWKKAALNELKMDNVFCIDPNFFQFIDTKILVYLNYVISCAEDNFYNDLSVQYFNKLKSNAYESAFIFGTGPSLSKGVEIAKKMKLDESLRVVCNGSINSSMLMDTIKPNLYVLSDIEIIMETLKEQMDRIADYVSKNECYLVVCNWWMPLLISRYAGLEDKLIGISDDAEQLTFPSSLNLKVFAKAHNVITRYAIPIASAISRKICITGCDGVDLSKDGNMVFSHADSIQERKQNAQQKSYFFQHYQYFEEILEYGESLGKKYVSLTDSFIPALSKRQDHNI